MSCENKALGHSLDDMLMYAKDYDSSADEQTELFWNPSTKCWAQPQQTKHQKCQNKAKTIWIPVSVIENKDGHLKSGYNLHTHDSP